jgi:hypothetical protein
MTLGLYPRRLLSTLVALAVLMIATPLLPAKAASDCDHMSMSASMAMDMKMDMKPAPATSQKSPMKPGLPCNDGLNCLGSAGCCTASSDQVAVATLPDVGWADAHWAGQSDGPSIAYKPALPPPILRS